MHIALLCATRRGYRSCYGLFVAPWINSLAYVVRCYLSEEYHER